MAWLPPSQQRPASSLRVHACRGHTAARAMRRAHRAHHRPTKRPRGGLQCISFTTCEPGSIVLSGHSGSSTTNRRCVPCGPAKYQDRANAYTCKPWSRCSAGTFVTADPSTVSDRECGPCDDGSFQPNPELISRELCAEWSTICTPGLYQAAAPTAEADRVCVVCKHGFYQDAPGQPECNEWTPVCAHGSVELAVRKKKNHREPTPFLLGLLSCSC